MTIERITEIIQDRIARYEYFKDAAQRRIDEIKHAVNDEVVFYGPVSSKIRKMAEAAEAEEHKIFECIEIIKALKNTLEIIKHEAEKE